MLIIPKLFVGLLGMLFLAMPFDTYAQERTKVTLDLKNVTLNEMFEEMKKQTDYDFFYNSQLLRARGFISVKADNEKPGVPDEQQPSDHPCQESGAAATGEFRAGQGARYGREGKSPAGSGGYHPWDNPRGFHGHGRASVVSAITTIRPTELRSSSSDLTTQLTGKIAGIVGWQTGGLPGALTEDEMNTQFYVRGVTSFMGSSEPLILLDGVETSRVDLARVPVEDIESFSVLKDAPWRKRCHSRDHEKGRGGKRLYFRALRSGGFHADG